MQSLLPTLVALRKLELATSRAPSASAFFVSRARGALPSAAKAQGHGRGVYAFMG